MHVLFVDDDRFVAESVETALEKKGHSCQAVGLGEVAISMAKRKPFDIVVLDVGLPDMDGYQVVRRLRMEGVNLPVVLQSGLADSGLEDEAQDLGVARYLTKPFSVAELIQHMEAVLAERPIETAPPAPEAPMAPPAPEAPAPPSPAPAPPPTAETPLVFSGQVSSFTVGRPASGAERRRDERVTTYEAALITNQGRLIPCVILNESNSGVAIRLFDAEIDCPVNFALRSLAGPERKCRLRWRNGDQIGAEFTD